MARAATPTRTGRPRASLRLLRGPGMTPEARAEEADMEAAALREDMKAAARRLRFVAYQSLWSETPRKHVLSIAERLEAQARNSESVA